jgi:hypothetical protein
MKSVNIFASLLALGLSGCQTTYIADSQAQRLDPTTSFIATACSGENPTSSQELRGHSLMYLSASIHTIVANSISMPYASIASPVDYADSRMTQIRFEPSAMARCSGTSLQTKLVRELGRVWLDYDLEIAPDTLVGKTDPISNSWRFRGRIKVNPTTASGYSHQNFQAFGREFVVDLNVTPGPIWLKEIHDLRAKEASEKAESMSYGKPLPDEMPGRTLEDVMRPEFK